MGEEERSGVFAHGGYFSPVGTSRREALTNAEVHVSTDVNLQMSVTVAAWTPKQEESTKWVIPHV